MQLRAVLNYPAVYRLFTRAIGGTQSRRRFADVFIRAQGGDRILDLGCGPAEILAFLPDVNYVGFDTNPAYISNAQNRWGRRGQFFCASAAAAANQHADTFDIALAIGVLHHLDDSDAVDLFRVAFSALRPGGRLVTFDGAYVEGQSPVARFLLSKDRGQYVRTVPEYRDLARQMFTNVTVEVAHDFIAPVPYTHIIMECAKS